MPFLLLLFGCILREAPGQTRPDEQAVLLPGIVSLVGERLPVFWRWQHPLCAPVDTGWVQTCIWAAVYSLASSILEEVNMQDTFLQNWYSADTDFSTSVLIRLK